MWISSVFSNLRECKLGVPQGSNLGPLFFMIYFNDLAFSLNCCVDNYADDTTLTATGKSVVEIGQVLSTDCSKVSQWMQKNKLKLNASKTHILTVGTAQKLDRLNDSVQVFMDGLALQESQSQSESVLGCVITANLKWRGHCNSLVVKLKSRLQGLKMLGKLAPFDVRLKIADGVFNSVLVYCLPLFGGTEAQNIKTLQVLQNKAAQVVCQLPLRTNRKTLFDRVGWLTVGQLVVYHTLLTVFRIRNTKEPEYLAYAMCNDSRGGRVRLPNFNLQIAQRSFTYRGAQYWNMLPEVIRCSSKESEFKNLSKQWVLKNISRFED